MCAQFFLLPSLTLFVDFNEQILDVFHNKIRTLPISLHTLQLRWLDIYGNPLLPPFHSIAREWDSANVEPANAVSQVLPILKEMALGSVSRCVMKKIVVVGEVMAGKTSLIRNLLHQQGGERKEDPTHWEEISSHTRSPHTRRENNRNRCWNTPN